MYITVKPKVRLYLTGAISKSVEDGELRNAQGYEGQIGVHVDYIPNNHVILRTGYRYGTSVGSNTDSFKEHRLLTELTLRHLLPGDLLLSDRNREDFRFVNGDFSLSLSQSRSLAGGSSVQGTQILVMSRGDF